MRGRGLLWDNMDWELSQSRWNHWYHMHLFSHIWLHETYKEQKILKLLKFHHIYLYLVCVFLSAAFLCQLLLVTEQQCRLMGYSTWFINVCIFFWRKRQLCQWFCSHVRLNKSNCDETQYLKLWRNSKSQMGTILKNSNADNI